MLLLQLCFVVGLSAIVAWAIGGLYLIIGGVLALVVLGLILNVQISDKATTFLDRLATIGLAIFLGLIWPSLPIIAVWGAGRSTARAVASDDTPRL